VRTGRKHLYDARRTGGLGLTSCGSCHIDARMDRLAWDLGNPAGEMKSVAGQNLGADVPVLNAGFEDWHPMKGPMLTQTLQDIIGKEPHHWRGDRDGIEEFNGAFIGLLGDDEMLTTEEMQEFEDFLATIYYPPNPYRTFENGMPTDLPLPGHYTTGDFGPAGQPLPNGDATSGRALFRPPNFLDAGALACVACHTRPTGMGTDTHLVGNTFQAVAPGPNGERHHALVAVDGSTNVSLKIPQLRNLYERTGMDLTQTENVAGFGFIHDGSVDSLARFVGEPAFVLSNDQQVADLVAFLLAFGGWSTPLGSPSNIQEPPGTASQSTHAAVGTQLTLAAAPSPSEQALLDAMIAEADQDDVGLVARGRLSGTTRGWMYAGNGRFQSDRSLERHTRAQLLATAAPGQELTFTVVPFGSQRRIGIDRDGDRAFDQDELDAGTDPANASDRPRVRRRPDLPGTAPARRIGAR